MATRSKQKSLARKANADKRPRAVAKYVRISPYKVRILLDIVRGKKYNEALAIVENTPKAASEVVAKLLKSAAANAENNLNMSKNDLYVAEGYAESARQSIPYRQTHEPHHRYFGHGEGVGGRKWDKKLIRTASE